MKRLSDLGFRVLATAGTAQVLRRNGVAAEVVGKFSDGPGNVVEKILAGEVDLVLNTPWGRRATPARASTATRSAPPRCRPASRA